MATVDKRGAKADIRVFPSSGLPLIFQVKDSGSAEDSGSAVDITNYTIVMTVSDDGGDAGYQRTSPVTSKTYSGTITDAANGTFTVSIPASDFSKLWGEQTSYGLVITPPGSADEPLAYGRLICEALV